MSSNWSDGKSLAEQTALVINRCIAEMGLRFTSGTTIKESADVILIGYGGEPGYSAQILRKGTIRDYVENPIRREMIKQKQYNREIGYYEIDFELPINLEPMAGYVTPITKAFELTFSIVRDWVNRTSNRDVSKDPVPIIINISDGAPTDENGYVMDDFSPVIREAGNIKSIYCPDGNPLIFISTFLQITTSIWWIISTQASQKSNNRISALFFSRIASRTWLISGERKT